MTAPIRFDEPAPRATLFALQTADAGIRMLDPLSEIHGCAETGATSDCSQQEWRVVPPSAESGSRSARPTPKERRRVTEALAQGDAMQVVSAPDWSVGLNSRSSNSLTDTVMLSRIGSGLRGLYEDILDEPLPEFLALFVRELESCEQADDPKAR